MKKLILLIVTATLIIPVGVTSVFAGATPKGKPFVAINEQFIEVKGAISSIQDQIDELVGRVDSLEALLAASEDAVQTLIDQNDSLSALLDANITTIDDINSEIALLNSEIANLQSMLQSLDGVDADLEAQIASNTALVASLSSALVGVQDGQIVLAEDLQEQIDHNSELISGLQSQIDQINADLALKQNIVDGLCFDGTAIQQILSDGSVVCGEAGGGMSGVLENVYTWVQVVANPNEYVQAFAHCPSGYQITGAGFASATGWEVDSIYPELGSASQWAKLRATNRNGFRDGILPVANCMRIAP